MFTQCTNCQAIFRIGLREATVSKGFLRCGECHSIFDSSKNVSTSMQTPFVATVKTQDNKRQLSKENLQAISALDDWQKSPIILSQPSQSHGKQSRTQKPIVKKTKISHSKPNTKSQAFKAEISDKSATKSSTPIKGGQTLAPKNIWLFITASCLGMLLIFQLAYNYRHLFLHSLKYDPKKIQMLNHNVFAHPIEKNVLLISASIENTADSDQPFPILEVRLTNSKSELIALRRFFPNEYLDNYSESSLLAKKRATSIKLNIQDPGNEATRFQFDFL